MLEKENSDCVKNTNGIEVDIVQYLNILLQKFSHAIDKFIL